MKKVVSSLVASVVAVSTALSSVGVFAKADDKTPKIYVDLVYETDTQIRADVIFENVPKTRSGGFHLKIANGWSVDSMGNTIGIL